MSLFEDARRVGYATTSYALKNDDEMFAVSYTTFLEQRYGSRREHIHDDAGVQAALMRYFRELCA